MGIATDSWLAYMDQMLTLVPSCVREKESLKRRKMLMLIDIYYDALDGPKKRKK
ncbi:Probable RNA-dependent RNA polymerase 5, partial [Ancistrocladus abbreviatus]